MWPYIVLIASPFIVQRFRIRYPTMCIVNTADKNSKAMKLFWGELLCLLILRHEKVGVDIKNYKRIFNYISDNKWRVALARSAEVGYSFINKLVSVFTEDFRWILIIVAIMSVLFVAKAYIRYSNDTGLTISLFIIMTNFILLFSGLRQSIAISIGFVAFEYVREKKLVQFVIVVVIAMLFHTSAFMIVFMYPLYHIKITKKRLIWAIIALGIVFVFNKQIFGVLAVILSSFTKYDAEISSTGAYTMIILFAALAIFAYIIPDESKLDKDTIGMRNYLLFAIALQMFAPLHDLAMRMNYYYIAFIPLVVPRIIERRSRRWNQVAVLARHIMVVFFIAYFFMTAPKDNSLQTFPYKFLWENTYL